ncbi:MAG TPA: hypothetical protein VGO93_21580 [Candidatus Xenobia bacterium]
MEVNAVLNSGAASAVTVVRQVGEAPRQSSGPADHTTFTPGQLPAGFDMVGRTHHLASQGQLHQASMPNTFPSESLALSNFLQTEFPGEMIPHTSEDLYSLSCQIGGKDGDMAHDQLYDMVQTVMAQDGGDAEEDQVAAGNDVQQEHMPVQPQEEYIPLDIDAQGFTEGGKQVAIDSMRVEAADQAGVPVECDEPTDSLDMNLEGREGQSYEVEVDWADGSSTMEECLAENPVSMDVFESR